MEDLTLKNMINLIIMQIRCGVINKKTGAKRPFDMLDYYLLTNMSLKEFVRKAKEFNIDVTGVKRFFFENRVISDLLDETPYIMQMIYIINNKEITLEQKKLIIEYLKGINAPVSISLFRLAVKKYLNGELVIENPKVYIKTC